jgi:topoisomerase-4 subunit B
MKQRQRIFSRNLMLEEDVIDTTKRKEQNFFIRMKPFQKYKYRYEYVIKMLKNYCYLNNGLTIVFNGEKYFSENERLIGRNNSCR